MANTISNSDDTIDSRDVIARIEELEGEREAWKEDHTDDEIQWETENEDEAAELTALKALQSEAEGYCDWQSGVSLIRDSYFEDYAEQLAADIGATTSDVMRWPYTCIDWKWAARELRMDYTSVEYDGVTYWVR